MPNDGCSSAAASSVLETRKVEGMRQHESKGPQLEWHCEFVELVARESSSEQLMALSAYRCLS